MAITFLLLGSNMGDRELFLEDARKKIGTSVGPVLQSSSSYQTAAWGKTDQPDFINQVLKVDTQLSPSDLLATVLQIERSLGREREELWGSRTIDIDILFYDSEEINLPDLKIPHPNLQKRAFTLVPLVEIQPDYIHPVFKKTVTQLLAELDDPLSVHQLKPKS